MRLRWLRTKYVSRTGIFKASDGVYRTTLRLQAQNERGCWQDIPVEEYISRDCLAQDMAAFEAAKNGCVELEVKP